MHEVDQAASAVMLIGVGALLIKLFASAVRSLGDPMFVGQRPAPFWWPRWKREAFDAAKCIPVGGV